MAAIKLKYSVDGNMSKVGFGTKKKDVKKAWINFKNLLPEDIEVIKKISKPLYRDGVVSMSTDNPREWDSPYTQPIIKALNYLINSGHYIMPSIDNIMSQMKQAYKDIVTNDDMSKAIKSTDEAWLEFMGRLNDPEMQSLFKSITPYYLGESAYGWKIAFNNVLRIKKEMPTATFIKTRKQWEDDYNRKINLNAQRILVLVPYDVKVRNEKEVMDRLGYGKNVKYGELSAQPKDTVNVLTRSGSASHYHWVPMYDISDTYLIDGEEDVFNNTVGLVNNLTGELNDLAIADQVSKGKGSKEDVNKIYHNENGNVILICNALYKGIQSNYPDIVVKMPKDKNNEELFEQSFIDMVEKIADRLIEDKTKIVKAENRKAGIKFTITAVLVLTRLNAHKVIQNINSDDFKPEFYYELREIINNIISLINKNMPKQENRNNLNEMQVPYLNSVEELLDILNVDKEEFNKKVQYNENLRKQLNTIKENFNKTLNKISKNG